MQTVDTTQLTNKNAFTNSFSEEVWASTYKYHKDTTVFDTFRRVAKAVASVEKTDELKKEWEEKFYEALSSFRFVPGGRILANAGTDWKNVGLINCFTAGRPSYDCDSIEGIMKVLKDQTLTLKSEGGWGLNFSFIRPRGSFIHGIGVESPGAVKYMELFDKSSDIITSGSGKESSKKEKKGKIRKGAQMAILSDWHPDLLEFITAKQTPGRLSKFNMSVNFSNKFMDMVVAATDEIKKGATKEAINNKYIWLFEFPDTSFPKYKEEWNGDIDLWKSKKYPTITYKEIPVLQLWENVTTSTYIRNEPGVLFLDRANESYTFNYSGLKISETNACSEQTMPPFSSCNLLSINLVTFFDPVKKEFDFKSLSKYSRIALRFSDNINSLTSAPLPEYEDSIKNLRRVGIGILGWASLLYLLKIRFASDKAEEFKKEVMKSICHSIIDESAMLAEEKGMFKGCVPELSSKHLFFDRIGITEEIKNKIAKNGLRNSSFFSIQPTGNTSIFANVVSGGCEPIFMQEYIRTVIVPNAPAEIESVTPKYWEGQFVETEAFKFAKEGDEQILRAEINGIVYKIDKNRGLTKEVLCEDYAVYFHKKNNTWEPSAEWAVTTTNITVEDHIKDLSGFTHWLDASCSKTTNIPNDYSYEKFSDIYLNAYLTGTIKGLTTYRAGTMTSVLSEVATKDDQSKKKPTCTTANSKIPKTHAPKRLKYLKGDIYHPVLKGTRYYVVVGLMDGEPYEVFTGINSNSEGEAIFPRTLEHGEVIKHGGGKYTFRKDSDSIERELTNLHNDPNADALSRLISTSLRHGASVEFVVQQLEKTRGELTHLTKVLGRTLKKYIKDGAVAGEKCPNCGSTQVVRTEGCARCQSCGSSRCS